MSAKPPFVSACALMLALTSPIVMADSFRCGAYIVREGMRSAEIAEKCGEPDRVRTHEEPVYTRMQDGTTVQTGVATTQYWYYDRGPNQFVARIAVRESLADEVELLNVRDLASVRDE